MSALVIKEWKVSNNQPIDQDGNYVRVVGRAGGLISWFLALLKVDPTTSIRVSQKRVEFSSASLSGTEHKMIPIGNVCSTYYGYHKPWKEALLLFFLFGFLLHIPGAIASAGSHSGISVPGYFLAIVIAVGIALLYYFLSRTLTLGFVEYSGVTCSIRFKRSVIENVDVNEAQARFICEVTQFLIEATRKSL
ncbi:MAG: hypothetical protein WCT12_14220 [Verrucomicrobiota bacterium]